MNFYGSLAPLARTLWQERLSALPGLSPADRFLAALSGDERTALTWFFAVLPPTDLTEYGPEFFLRHYRFACGLRRAYPWCAALPEGEFLLYVAFPRVNNEELSDPRPDMEAQLRPRVAGLSLPEAILEVNRWCAQQVTYRSTDDRTASARQVGEAGFGRCGEESLFAVTALRSVGIAARQVYAPWWSHCDDNHAWVEAFDGERWRFFGACEPEPRLDMGWFPPAAARAMVIHTRTFCPDPRAEGLFFPDARPEDRFFEDGKRFQLVTGRYAATRPFTVTVRTPAGEPVPGARVRFAVLNMGVYRSVAVTATDAQGRAVLRLGLGSIKLIVFTEKPSRYEALLDTAKLEAFTVVLPESPSAPVSPSAAQTFAPPAGSPPAGPVLTPAERAARRRTLEEAAAARAARPGVPVPHDLTPAEHQVWATLSEKDRSFPVDPQVLRDAATAAPFSADLLEELFAPAVLCPRLATEPLRPWRQALLHRLTPQQRQAFVRSPAAAWDWITDRFSVLSTHTDVTASPLAVLDLQAGSPASLAALFVAVCRCLGVPARVDPCSPVPEYRQNGTWRPADGRPAAPFVFQAGRVPLALSRLGEPDRLVLTVPAGASRSVALPPGAYRLTAVERLPSGAQQVSERLLESPRDAGPWTLDLPAPPLESLFSDFSLPDFALTDPSGQLCPALEPLCLVAWLEPGREPTEHLLLELLDWSDDLRQLNCPLHLVVEDGSAGSDPTLRRVLESGLPVRLWQAPLETEELLARRTFLEPGRLPLLLLVRGGARCLFAAAGYRVGSVALAARLFAAAPAL